MSTDDTSEGTGQPRSTQQDQLRDANEQLLLSALNAQQRADESEHCLRDQATALLKKQEELRGLASELMRTEQRERKRLALELHDYLAQMLVLGRLTIGQARPRIALADPFLINLISDLDDIFNKSLAYTRTLMVDLSPPTLRKAGLPSSLKGLGEQMMKHGLTVELPALPDDILLPDDHAILLYQSVRELLLNVVKHAHTNRAIVSVSIDENEKLTLLVQDHGLGFDTGSLQARAGGEHFGLMSVRERMQAMGGSFEADSGLGRGTTITLRLPLKSAQVFEALSLAATMSVEPRAEPFDSSSGVRRVLLVDDHAMVRQGLRAILEGYADLTIIGEAANGLEAVARAADLTPDVILMDINMPKMDGIEATRLIKATQPLAVIIGLSVIKTVQVVEAAERAGVAAFISKDVAAEQLYDAISALVPRGQKPSHPKI